MKDSYYVIFNKRGVDRWTKTESFQLKAGEHAVKMVIIIPDEIFVKPPIATCEITIDPSQVTRNISAVAEGTEEDGE